MIFEFLLHILHVLNYLFPFFSVWRVEVPKGLLTTRRRIPNHLALLLIGEDSTIAPEYHEDSTDNMLESVRRVIAWCKSLGINKLSVYDRHGIVQRHCQDFDTKLHLHLLSRASSKPHLASIAKSLALLHLRSETSTPESISEPGFSSPVKRTQIRFELSVDELDCLIEGEEDMFSSPDLLIVHQTSRTPGLEMLELHGFPPWQIRLTEISRVKPKHWLLDWFTGFPWSRNQQYRAIDELQFRTALDEFSEAEMRMGK